MFNTIYRFGNHELDPKYRELRHNCQPVSLPLKSFDCLCYLVEHRDRAVGRDELISAVWGSTEINDHTLAQTLSRVRQALRDSDGDPFSILTVPRFGYRWTAQTEQLEIEPGLVAGSEQGAFRESTVQAVDQKPSEAASPPQAPPSSPPRHAGRPFRWPVLVLMIAVLTGIAWLAVRQSGDPKASDEHGASIASADVSLPDTYLVMPVTLDRTDPDTAWIRLGLMDYINTAIGGGGTQRVVPSDQVIGLAANRGDGDGLDEATIRELMRLTRATYAVQPRARVARGGWRFDLALIRPAGETNYTGQAPTPIEAAAAALRVLMQDLELADTTLPEPTSREELLRHIDAALLASDLMAAQRLVEADVHLVESDPQVRIRAAQVALRLGRLDEAKLLFQALLEPGLELAQDLRAEAWIGLGGTDLHRADFQAAHLAYTEAIEMLQDSGNHRLLGSAYLSRGATYANRNRFVEAMADFGRARVELELVGDRIGIARLENNIANADLYRGRLVQAIEAQNRAIAVLSDFGLSEQLAAVMNNKVQTQMAMMEFVQALETSAEAVRHAERSGNAIMRSRVVAARTRALLSTGRLTEASRLIDRFTAGDGHEVADSEFALLRLDLLMQHRQYEEAAALAPASVASILRTGGYAGDPTLAPTCLIGTDAALRVGRLDVARSLADQLKQAPHVERDLGRPIFLALIEAELARAEGRRDAHDRFSEALAATESRGDDGLILLASTMWLRHLLADGNLDTALPIVGRLERYSDKNYVAARAVYAYYHALGQRALSDENLARVLSLAGERDPALPL